MTQTRNSFLRLTNARCRPIWHCIFKTLFPGPVQKGWNTWALIINKWKCIWDFSSFVFPSKKSVNYVCARARKFHAVCGNSFVGFICFLNVTVEKTKQTNYEGGIVEWEEHIIITIYTRKSILRGVRIQELFHYNCFRCTSQLFECSQVLPKCQRVQRQFVTRC